MKVTLNIEVTPQEARSFFGMPNVEPMNDMIMAEMMKRAKNSMDTLADPERLVAAWVNMGGKGIEGLQAVMGAAMSGAMGGGSKKK